MVGSLVRQIPGTEFCTLALGINAMVHLFLGKCSYDAVLGTEYLLALCAE